MSEELSRARKLAIDHAEYLLSVLEVHGIADAEQRRIASHYIEAFVHGYKHGYTDVGKLMPSVVPTEFNDWLVIQRDGNIALAKIVDSKWKVVNIGTKWSVEKALTATSKVNLRDGP